MQWYIRQSDQSEQGPLSYQDLADLLNRGLLQHESLVRPEYTSTFQRADSVVGLLVTARRLASSTATPERPVAEVCAAADVPADPGTDATLQDTEAESATGRLNGSHRAHPGIIGWLLMVLGWLPGRQGTSVAMSVRPDAAPLTEAEPVTDGDGTLRAGVIFGQTAEERPQARSETAGSWSGEVVRTQETVPPADGGTVFDLASLLADEPEFQPLLHAAQPMSSLRAAADSAGPTVFDLDGNSGGPVAAGDLDGAIARAARDWDARHQPVSSNRPSESISARLIARLNPLPLVERLLLWLLKKPIAAAGVTLESANRLMTRLSRTIGPNSVSLVFRGVCAFVAANLAILVVEARAGSEALRFPGWQEQRHVRSFPLLGECSPGEYWFLTIDVAIVAAVVAFVLARHITFDSDG